MTIEARQSNENVLEGIPINDFVSAGVDFMENIALTWIVTS